MTPYLTLRTGISKVRYCDPNQNYAFKAAAIDGVTANFTQSNKEMSWFDELFRGGIRIPLTNTQERAVTLLITGPPGTGKSTLALELCVRLAQMSRTEGTNLGANTLYVVSDAYPDWMKANAEAFGWISEPGGGDDPFRAGEREPNIKILTLAEVQKAHTGLTNDLLKMLNLTSANLKSDLLVIDSLNTIKSEERGKEFDSLYNEFVQSGPKLMVFVLDSSPHHAIAETWEFAADLVLRLDREYRGGYMIRTIEIIKARYQPHVWGKHQLKIYEKQLLPPTLKQSAGKGDLKQEQRRRVRAHPWAEGGVFIFPSIHYILSRLKRIPPRPLDNRTESTPLKTLNLLLGGGIPSGHATALLGDRGAHKSHLGYFQALHNVIGADNDKRDGNSLIISLRDDEAMTMQTLQSIRDKHFLPGSATIEDLLQSGRLEIAYYMPGYITPEEFFHRLLLSINRMRQDKPDRPITVLFNSLDQISSRFPLCAEEKVFIPGIIQTLAALSITSVFIAADSEGIDEGLKNLLSMAELIIRVRRHERFRTDRLFKILPNAFLPVPPRRAALPKEFSTTELTVERYAGGKPAGSQGLLELVTDDSEPVLKLLPQGLQFIPYRKLSDRNAGRVHARTGRAGAR